MKRAVLAPIVAYQRYISPAFPRRCKYYPTCSAYAVEAIREVGVVRGLILAAWRLVRCNPFSNGGYDPVENRAFFRPRQKRDPAQTARRRTRERAREHQRGKFASELAGNRRDSSERERSTSRA